MDYIAEQIKFNLTDPPFWMQIAVYWVIINAINAMPMPDAHSSKFYQWFHTFAAGLAGNISRAAAKKGLPSTDTVSVTETKTTTIVSPEETSKDK